MHVKFVNTKKNNQFCTKHIQNIYSFCTMMVIIDLHIIIFNLPAIQFSDITVVSRSYFGTFKEIGGKRL